MILLLALLTYVWTKDPIQGSLLAQLPAQAASVGAASTTPSETVQSTKTNPAGEALLDEVLAKPLETKETSATTDSVQKPADQQLVPANAAPEGDSAAAMPKDDAGTRVKSQLSGTADYTYSVKPGETLYGIASRFKVPAATLRELNALADNNVQAGQALRVRIQGIHKVGASEGLAAIARTYGVTVAELRKANGLASDQLQLGQELVVPVK